jgi:hypothetical protein
MKIFLEQFEVRDKHFETQLKAKDLEKQLVEAKLLQQTQISAQDSLSVI